MFESFQSRYFGAQKPKQFGLWNTGTKKKQNYQLDNIKLELHLHRCSLGSPLIIMIWPRYSKTGFYLDILRLQLKNIRIWLINNEIRSILKCKFDVPCRTSLRCCSRGSPSVLICISKIFNSSKKENDLQKFQNLRFGNLYIYRIRDKSYLYK